MFLWRSLRGCNSERIIKIGQHLRKLCSNEKGPVFWTHSLEWCTWLPGGEKFLKIRLFIRYSVVKNFSTEYKNVTDIQMDGHRMTAQAPRLYTGKNQSEKATSDIRIGHEKNTLVNMQRFVCRGGLVPQKLLHAICTGQEFNVACWNIWSASWWREQVDLLSQRGRAMLRVCQ